MACLLRTRRRLQCLRNSGSSKEATILQRLLPSYQSSPSLCKELGWSRFYNRRVVEVVMLVVLVVVIMAEAVVL